MPDGLHTLGRWTRDRARADVEDPRPGAVLLPGRLVWPRLHLRQLPLHLHRSGRVALRRLGRSRIQPHDRGHRGQLPRLRERAGRFLPGGRTARRHHLADGVAAPAMRWAVVRSMCAARSRDARPGAPPGGSSRPASAMCATCRPPWEPPRAECSSRRTSSRELPRVGTRYGSRRGAAAFRDFARRGSARADSRLRG